MLKKFFNMFEISPIGALMCYILTIMDLFTNRGDNMYTYFIIALLFHNMYLTERGGK